MIWIAPFKKDTDACFDYLLNRPEVENIGAKVNADMRVLSLSASTGERGRSPQLARSRTKCELRSSKSEVRTSGPFGIPPRLAVHGLEGETKNGGNINTYYDDPHGATGRFDFALPNSPFNVNPLDTSMRKLPELLALITYVDIVGLERAKVKETFLNGLATSGKPGKLPLLTGKSSKAEFGELHNVPEQPPRYLSCPDGPAARKQHILESARRPLRIIGGTVTECPAHRELNDTSSDELRRIRYRLFTYDK